MKPPPGRHYILLFRGRGVVSALIRWQTRSAYSHAAILLPDGETIIEAWQFKGVQERKLTDWQGIDAFMVPSMDDWQWAKAVEHARQQIGKPYDYRGVFRFLTRSEADDNGKLFCSELVFASCLHGRAHLLKRIKPGAVAPSHLAISPLLEGPVMCDRS